MPVFLSCAEAAEVPNLQNSVERFDPGKTSTDLSEPDFSKSREAPPNVVNIKGKQATPAPVDEAKTNIKFRLKKIVLSGNTVFSTNTLAELYADKINTDISLADLEQIAQKITDYYRAAGYVLCQAIIPPQEITADGIVRINIIEGYISKVSVTGCSKDKVCALLTEYGKHIASNAPLELADLERYSFLANDIPGIKVRAVLTRSTEHVGAADLTFVVEEKNYGASIAYNDYNSKVLGRQQFIGNVYLDNLTTASETTINGIVSRNTNRMDYVSFTHKQQLNTYGLGGRFSISNIHTDPDMDAIGLGGLVIPGKAFTFNIGGDYAWIRSHKRNLTVGANFKFLNSTTEFAGLTLFKDNIRSVSAYLSYNTLQGASTYNSLLLTVVQGLKIFDAQGNPPSRVGEDLTFTSLNGYASSAHRFGNTKFSSLIAAKGQLAFETVPSSETFSYGGIPFGCGYDPAEFSGDRGIAGMVELQYPGPQAQNLTLFSQLFAFFDFGYVWDTNNIQPTMQSGASTGVGFRANMLRHVNFDFLVAKPLKPSNIQGNANYTRLLFNLKLYV